VASLAADGRNYRSGHERRVVSVMSTPECSIPMGAVALARVPLAGLKVASRAP
jgi:hypothetical protein